MLFKTQKELQPIIQKSLITKFSKKKANDIAFHMTDWLTDLEKLCKYLQNPKKFSDRNAYKVLNNFLLHAPNHIVAATKLVTGEPVVDVFDINAVSEKK